MQQPPRYLQGTASSRGKQSTSSAPNTPRPALTPRAPLSAKPSAIKHEINKPKSPDSRPSSRLRSRIAPAADRKTTFHIVSNGETLDGIAQQYDLTLKELLSVNFLLHAKLHENLRLIITPPNPPLTVQQKLLLLEKWTKSLRLESVRRFLVERLTAVPKTPARMREALRKRIAAEITRSAERCLSFGNSKEEETRTSLLILPNDCIKVILSFLPMKDIVNMAYVSRVARDCCSSETWWRYYFHVNYSNLCSKSIASYMMDEAAGPLYRDPILTSFSLALASEVLAPKLKSTSSTAGVPVILLAGANPWRDLCYFLWLRMTLFVPSSLGTKVAWSAFYKCHLCREYLNVNTSCVSLPVYAHTACAVRWCNLTFVPYLPTAPFTEYEKDAITRWYWRNKKADETPNCIGVRTKNALSFSVLTT